MDFFIHFSSTLLSIFFSFPCFPCRLPLFENVLIVGVRRANFHSKTLSPHRLIFDLKRTTFIPAKTSSSHTLFTNAVPSYTSIRRAGVFLIKSFLNSLDDTKAVLCFVSGSDYTGKQGSIGG